MNDSRQQHSSESNSESVKNHKFDCAILNMWNGVNYGANLTAFALQQAVKRLGYTSVLINPAHPSMNEVYFGSTFEDFAKKHLVTSELYPVNGLAKANELSDRFIVGSDQVFRFEYNDSRNHYFLNFIDYEKVKIAFSASFGKNDFTCPEQFVERYRCWLSRFDDISTRELSGVDICQKKFNVPAQCMIDPVFTLDKATLDELVGESKLQDKDYLLAYVLDDNEELNKTIAMIAEQKGLKVVRINLGGHTIPDWLYLIKNASYVITDSFHGLCFAIIFNRQVRCLINVNRGADRFISIQTMLELPKSVLFSEPNSLLEEQHIDYDTVNAYIKARAAECMRHLEYVMNIQKKITAEGRRKDQKLLEQAAHVPPIYEFNGSKRLKYKCKAAMYHYLYILLKSQSYQERYLHYQEKLASEIKYQAVFG